MISLGGSIPLSALRKSGPFRRGRRVCAVLLAFVGTLLVSGLAQAGPSVTVALEDASEKDLSTGLQILILITILSLVPAILLMVTSFARIVIVLSFLRQAMATNHGLPPSMYSTRRH